MKFFLTPFISLFGGLFLAGAFSWMLKSDVQVLFQNLFTVIMLSILEISLSFDNAVVNATVLKKMDSLWQKRFLTWGMIVAVFGMRLLFPLAIVSIIAGISMSEALLMSISRPAEYSAVMTSAHLAVMAFGGSFLLMVFLDFLFEAKEHHWVPFLEKPAQKLSEVKCIELITAFLVFTPIYFKMPELNQSTFLTAVISGLVTYIAVSGLGSLLASERLSKMPLLSSGFGMFLYLEVLDASFSFDGVVGAFALSNQMIIIVIGLGIGAFFVRGITLYLVEKKALDQFIFLEHGAFYALGTLSLYMLLDHFFHFSEIVTGLSGAVILTLSILWSIQENRKATTRNNNKSS